jgi:uncharacterized glyoxalase superfamily protein PhnB
MDEAVQNPPPDWPQITVSLTYDDVEAAARWLCEVFGFRERTATRVVHEGVLYHTELELGERGLVMLGPPFADRASPRTRGGTTVMLNAYVEDVATHLERARRAGAEILAELEDTFYGDRTYRVSDLEGHHWMFAQRTRDIPPEEWDWSPA